MSKRGIMKRTVVLIVVAVLIVAALAGVLYYNFVMPKGPETIKIGFIAPLSPPGSYYAGTEMRVAAQMLIDSLNDNGGLLGKQVELIVGDTQGIPDKGKSIVEKMITLDKVVGICGGFHSSVGFAVIEVVKQYHIPYVIAYQANDDLTAKSYKEVFRVGPFASLERYDTVNYLKELYDLGEIHNVAAIWEDSDWAIGFRSAFEPMLTAIGLNYSEVSVDRTLVDFTPFLLQLRERTPRPDVLLLGITGAGSYLAVKQAKEIAFAPTTETPFLIDVAGACDTPEFWEIAGEAGKYVMVRAGGHPSVSYTALGENVTNEYRTKYSYEPTSSVYMAYDSVLALTKAIENAGSTNADSIITALENLNIAGTRQGSPLKFGGEDKTGTVWYHQATAFTIVAQYQEIQQPWNDTVVLYPPQVVTGTYVKP
jgi:ABC-type branched-subunit amino acid transport system substrate-binding protein